MSKRKTQQATATDPQQKILEKQRARATRLLLKRRRRKSHQ